MIFGISLADFLLFASVLAGGAIIAGFIAGLFGVGGGVVMVPILTELFALGLGDSNAEHAQHLAVGTSLAIIIPTSIRSARTHYASGKMDMGLLRSYLIFVPLGVLLGLVAANYMDASGLGIVFGAIALFVGLYQLVSSPNLRLAEKVPGAPIRQFAGLFIGTSSTLMGIGGGVVNNLFMSLTGADIKRAIATSAGVGVLISIPAAIGFAVIG
ncbi:MAG: sulfite exporter TauE/SafE family protein, partial [Alphaproteobacteria bacterium]